MFSGTPPPSTRRVASSRRSSRAFSALASGQTTPRGSPPPSLVPSRSLGAGLNTASRALSASPAPGAKRRGVKSSIATVSEVGMEVNEGSEREEVEKVLVKSESYVVLERKGLPAEVEEVLLAADPYTDPFRATLDSLTGFAYLISREYCFVWNWSRRSSSSTTYIFPLPPSLSLPATISAFSPLSFASFVPTSTHPSSREPGLLVLSTTGDIRYWENVSMALSGVDRWKSASAGLFDGELVRGLHQLSSTAYLISTSQARLLLISLSSVGGRVDLAVRPFERPHGWAGSVWSAVFGAKAADPRAGILALALSGPTVDGERIAYAVTEKNVQVWRLPARDDGGARLAIEQDLFAGVLEALLGEKVGNEEWAINEGKVEIVDAVVAPTGSLAVLVSHVAEYTAPNALSYAIVLLDVGTTQNSVTVAGLRHLAYQAHPDPRPLSAPKLSLPGGDTAFVIFVDAVVMLSLSPESAFEESFPLRSNTNRFLGISNPSPFVLSATQSLTLLTSTASLLSVEITASQGLIADLPGTEGLKTRKLKSKIEQAIFYGGDAADNPLAFDLLPDFEGDLTAAAEAVSAEILSSSSANMPSILDLRAQLADRIARARGLIDYINSNGLLGKLSQSSRRQLSWDAEKLAAVAVLWHHQNARLGDGESLLADAIETFMNETGEGYGDDPLRLFYRTKVASIGKILEQVTKLAKSLLASSPSSEARSPTLHEGNAIVVLVMTAITRHRKDTATLYGLDASLLPTELWSSQPSMLDGLQWHFDATDALLRERSRDFGTALNEETSSNYDSRARGATADISTQQAMQAELKKQMSSLADFVFYAYEERLLFLKTINGEGVTSPESRVLTDRYLALRPRFIQTLVSIDKVNHAYELAERHRDFRSLVELCNDAQHGSDVRVRSFMKKYAEEFAFALYQFLVEEGRLRALLEQDEPYQPLLTKFLDSTDNPRISWLNDIAIGRYAHATESLVSESLKEQDLAQKKLMLSLAKLNQVAQTTKESIGTEDVQRAIEAVDDDLDLVNAQQGLVETFQAILSASDRRLSLAQQAETIAGRVAPCLQDRPAFSQLYAKLVKQLLQGQSLSPEDLIDLLTLKENMGAQSGDFASALEILVRAKNMPDARKEIALQNIWRRVYLRDNWEALHSAVGLKDEELAHALRSTALFATVAAAAGANHPASLYLEPARSMFTGTAEEVAARFADAPAHQVDLVLNDFEKESGDLREAIQHHGLDGYCGEVMRLWGEEEREDLAVGDDSMVE